MLELGLIAVGLVLLVAVIVVLAGLRSGLRLKRGGVPHASDVDDSRPGSFSG